MEIRRRKSFTKTFEKLPLGIQKKTLVTLELFMLDPKHPLLSNHALQGSLHMYRSLQVTGDYRIIFRELSDGTYELVELINVGTHSQLYG